MITTVMITQHDRNGIIIGDFQYEGKAISAVLINRQTIIFGKDSLLGEISYVAHSEEPGVMDVLAAIADYTLDDVQADYGGKIIFVNYGGK